MARRIRWQILIATLSSLVVLGLISYLALTTAAVSRPLEGGAYVEGVTVPPRQLNPLASDPTRDPTGADVQALIFEGLMRIGNDGLPEPALAQSWPEISEAGTVYTFTLRTDVTWHDGMPLTVDDVLFTLRAVQQPGFAGNPAVQGVWSKVLVEKVADQQLRCTLPSPFAPFLSQAAFPILPAHLLADVPPEQWANAAFSRRPVGTGPYQLVELNDQHVLLKTNPGYHDQRPFLDSIEFRFFDSAQEALLALTRGEIEGFGFAGTSEVSRLNLPRGVSRRITPLDAYTVLTFNLRSAPLADQGLRRALARGLDKDALITSALNGQVARIDTPILPGWWASIPDAAPYAADPQAAADALSSLDYLPGPDGIRVRDGQPLVLPLITDDQPDRAAAAQEIARQWGALGVKVEIEQLDGPTLQQRLSQRQFTMALHGWQRLGADPDVLELWHSDLAESGRNYAGLNDPQVDGLLADARETLDIGTRKDLYTAFQHRWMDLTPSITLYQPLFIYTTRELGGLELTPDEDAASGGRLLIGREDRFRNVARWFLRSAREIRGELRTPVPLP